MAEAVCIWASGFPVLIGGWKRRSISYSGRFIALTYCFPDRESITSPDISEPTGSSTLVASTRKDVDSPLIFVSISIFDGPRVCSENRYSPAGTSAFCHSTECGRLKRPPSSCAEARVGAKLKELKSRTTAYTNL